MGSTALRNSVGHNCGEDRNGYTRPKVFMNFRVVLVLLLFSSVRLLAQQADPTFPLAQSSDATSTDTTVKTSSEKQTALDLTPDADGALSQQQMQELFRIVADKDIKNSKVEREYTYIERDTDKNLDGKGQVKSTETKTFEVLEIYGEQVQRLSEKDGKPVSAKDTSKEEEKLQK